MNIKCAFGFHSYDCAFYVRPMPIFNWTPITFDHFTGRVGGGQRFISGFWSSGKAAICNRCGHEKRVKDGDPLPVVMPDFCR